ncbi:MAG: T9SS type A sorting domain-containing protein [Bacteroidales bacterium]|nr:T9SS type A sorting domain-containing protein [Bacteroidales bacterium]
MRKLFLKISLISLFFLPVIDGNIFGQKKILFLGREALGTHAADQDLYDKCVAWGYTVDYITALPATAEDYSGYIGIFMNETIGSSTVNSFSTNNYPVPCVCLEGWAVLANRWGGWVKDESTTDPKTDWDQHSGAGADGQEIVIRDNTHYITRGYNITENVAWSNSTVQETITNTNPVSFKEVDRKYSAKLAQAKSFKEDGYWTMVTVDSAEAGFPNRVFVWGLVSAGVEGISPFTEHAATDDYFKIIERACEWAFEGKLPPSGIETTSGDDLFHVYPNPCTDAVNIRYFATGKENTIKVTLNSLTGQELQAKTVNINSNGYYFVTIDLKDTPAGVYIVNLEVNDKVASKKVTVQ